MSEHPNAAVIRSVYEAIGKADMAAVAALLANDDHAVILHESTLTVGDRTHTGQYADIYHVRDGKITAHWHLAIAPKADAEFASGFFAS